MAYESILFSGEQRDPQPEGAAAPGFYKDLHLDDIIAAAVAGREEYELVPYFRTPLDSLKEIGYRQEIVHDLESSRLRRCVEEFAADLRAMRAKRNQSEKLYYPYQKAAWFLDAVATYCRGAEFLARELSDAEVHSRGLLAMRDYVRAYVDGSSFRSLVEETMQLRERLLAVRYSLHLKGSRITISEYGPAPDYGRELQAAFAKFRQGDVHDYRVAFSEYPQMNHVEAEVLERVAKLHAELFAALGSYPQRRADYLDPVLARFDREVQFYLAYLDLIGPLQEAGSVFSSPQLTLDRKAEHALATFDLALAIGLARDGRQAVYNDFRLDGPERAFVVSGPNQGGKTTFARTFGQLHHLARLGLPVPGREVKLLLCDGIYTQFGRAESVEDLRGRLQDELLQLRDILSAATDRSVLIMNETFASTSLHDARLLGREILERAIGKDMLCVYVTFVDELSTLGAATVSMVSSVDPKDPTARTFKVERRPADGLAYAMALAQKHGLTYDMLRGRLIR